MFSILIEAAEINPAEHFIWDATFTGFGLRVLAEGEALGSNVHCKGVQRG